MNMKHFVGKILLHLVFLSAFTQFNYAQEKVIGKVIDAKNGETIPYCNISIESSLMGTVSNELGEFIVEVDSLPVKLVLSHISYGEKVIEISQNSDNVLELQPFTNNLDEVTVLGDKKDFYALELAQKAFQKAHRQSSERKYGKAFYRQKSKNGDNYSEFSEIIYDIRYTSKGIEDWGILEGRYALKDEFVNNKNYTLLSRLLTPLQPDTDEIFLPLNENMESYYSPRVVDIIESDEGKIMVVWFKPASHAPKTTFEGEVYINADTYDILKVTGNLEEDDLDLVRLKEKNSSWKNYKIAYEISYKIDNTIGSVIDYIKVDQSFDYYKDEKLKYPVSSTSNLIFFEYYVPLSWKKLGGNFKKRKSDWQLLDEIGYNEKFWEDNPIVKRTPVENEVISAFEKDKAFGSIFLNSREQIAFEQSNLANDPLINDLNKVVVNYNNYNPVEKVYLHTDKDLFSVGETMWYSGYTVLGPLHRYSLGSGVLQVDLIDPKNKIVVSKTHAIDEGRSSGSIDIPKNLPSGTYQLRAYTQWMRNFDHDFFFAKKITVLNGASKPSNSPNSETKIDLQFFPESGYSIAGLAGKIAFKAIGNDGLETEVKGKVINTKGKSVAPLNTIDRGAGFVQLAPEKGEQYTAVLENGNQYPLPQIMDMGYSMTVNNTSEKSVRVKVQASDELKRQPFYVVGHINNRKYYHGKFEFGNNEFVDFEIPKNGIPSGVMTLTLFDRHMKPWCERVLFVNNQEELVITTRIDKKTFVKREKVTVGINVADVYGKPIATELSMAVTDAKQVEKKISSGNILTHLLLQSDLKGHISNPGLLFKDLESATVQRLDLVMLTHGWRKFPWQEIKADSNFPKIFEFSKGLQISGIAETPFGKPLPNATLNIIAKSEDEIGMYTAKSEINGKFSVPDFNFNGETQLVFNAFDIRNKAVDVKIALDKNQIDVPEPEFQSHSEFVRTTEAEKYIEVANTRNRFSTLFEFDKVTALDEVVVTDKKIEKSRNESPSTFGQTPDATVYAEDHVGLQTVLQLVSLFNGVTVNGTMVSIRNQGPPLWVLNGIPISNNNPSPIELAQERQDQARSNRQANGDARPVQLRISIEQAMAQGPAPTFVTTLDTYSIERVELLKGPAAAIWGSRGANGVILIYTKRGGGTEPILAPDFTLLGHSSKREFYSPKYDVKEERHSTPDYRATLYWNPSITTDKNGNAFIEFFNSDVAEQIQIEIEGLSADGTPGAYLQTFGKQNQPD